MDDQVRFQWFAGRVERLCSHVSIRDDENGPYVFALGLKGLHTLQLRRTGAQYVIELWHGDAYNERVVDEPSCASAEEAFDVAEQWLLRDAVDP